MLLLIKRNFKLALFIQNIIKKKYLNNTINNFKLSGSYWTKRKQFYLYFYEKRERVHSVVILANIISIGPLEIILWLKRQLNSFSFFIKRQLTLWLSRGLIKNE